MTDYAVVNPATGETVKTYPTITDADLKDAITRADDARTTRGRRPQPSRSARRL